MKRRVIQIAESTQLISLPRKWALQNNIVKGAELEIEEDGNRLIVNGANDPLPTTSEIVLGEFGKVGHRILGALFKSGCDEIKIHYSSDFERKEIDRVMAEFIGFEILKDDGQSCTIKEVSIATYDEFESILKRSFLLLSSVSTDCLESIKKGSIEMLPSIMDRDVTINKYTNFCRRLLNKRGHPDIKRTNMVYCIVEQLESLGDVYKALSKHIHENNVVIKNKKILDLFSGLNEWVNEFFKIYPKFSKEKLVAYAQGREHLLERFNELYKTRVMEEVRVIFFLHRILEITADMAGPLLTMQSIELFERKKS